MIISIITGSYESVNTHTTNDCLITLSLALEYFCLYSVYGELYSLKLFWRVLIKMPTTNPTILF